MPIIINEFEIIPEPPPPASNGPQPEQPAESAPRPRPEEIMRVVNRQRERRRRLWAD
jgi:hypothetical protein